MRVVVIEFLILYIVKCVSEFIVQYFFYSLKFSFEGKEMFLGILNSPEDILNRFFDRIEKSHFFVKWE